MDASSDGCLGASSGETSRRSFRQHGFTREDAEMAEHPDPELIVRLSSHASPALSEPKFIVKAGDNYYVTLAVWAYEPGKAMTDAQKAGVQEIARLFRLSEPVEARIPPTRDLIQAAHTSPGEPSSDGRGNSLRDRVERR